MRMDIEFMVYHAYDGQVTLLNVFDPYRLVIRVILLLKGPDYEGLNCSKTQPYERAVRGTAQGIMVPIIILYISSDISGCGKWKWNPNKSRIAVYIKCLFARLPLAALALLLLLLFALPRALLLLGLHARTLGRRCGCAGLLFAHVAGIGNKL